MNENRIRAYAELLIRVGLNLQKGQTLLIACPVECAAFARLCAKAAYGAGCREVVMNWSDDELRREKFLHADDSVFDEHPAWRTEFFNGYARQGAAYLALYSEDPEAMAGVDPERIRRSSIASGNAIRFFRDAQTANAFPWCVASVPCAAWAAKVFPDLASEKAADALWNAILDAVRVYENGDPVREWQEHTQRLQKRVDQLNHYNFRCLRYRNALGTDLTVELPENHFWAGGAEKTTGGTVFCANMPTEEIFTAPKRDGVNGVVYASRPLIVNGDIADQFAFEIKDGRINGISAVRGLELLKAATSVDEGAAFLGEVALVPCDSPISRSGLLFYNTLFDENASCHLAFGAAYPCVKDSAALSPAERQSLGLNDSIVHEDFMIGTEDLSITGMTHDGREIPVFVNGNFVF